MQPSIAEAGRRQLLVALGGCFVRGGGAQQRLQRTRPGRGDMSLRVIRALLGPTHIADGGTAPRFVAVQFQVALLDLKRPLPQLFDPRARLPEKLVPICHRFMLTRKRGHDAGGSLGGRGRRRRGRGGGSGGLKSLRPW